jgi:hypothetical protein
MPPGFAVGARITTGKSRKYASRSTHSTPMSFERAAIRYHAKSKTLRSHDPSRTCCDRPVMSLMYSRMCCAGKGSLSSQSRKCSCKSAECLMRARQLYPERSPVALTYRKASFATCERHAEDKSRSLPHAG